MDTLSIVIMILIVGLIYFLPTIVAFGKGRSNSFAIFALNLFLGFTLLGWVIALVWALTEDSVKIKNKNA